MYCPECGADAGAANFCPECGTDLRDVPDSPDCSACGAEVPDGARFCPECGEPTGAGGARAAKPAAGASSGGGRRTGTRGKSAGAGQQRQQRRQQPRQTASSSASKTPGRVSPAMAWGVLGAVVVFAIIIVVIFARGAGGGGDAASTPTAGSQPAQAVAADTSGSYTELVQRANGLYDQGAAKFQTKDFAQGGEYFLAASKVYAAAWKQQATDPSVGTDFATSLFYAGKVDEAIAQVEQVLAKSPQFQTAWFNKGNYLAERARQAEQDGDAKSAKADNAAARVAYQKAVDIDPQSSSGQSAKQQLSELPQ